ncbi:hypothetical protein QJQ45_028834, partial [Haematococcus lacustris]
CTPTYFHQSGNQQSSRMSSAGGPFYRAAGLSFLRYANISADLLRNVLKEPFKTKAQARQVITFKYSPISEGRMGKSTSFDMPAMPVKQSVAASSS